MIVYFDWLEYSKREKVALKEKKGISETGGSDMVTANYTLLWTISFTGDTASWAGAWRF